MKLYKLLSFEFQIYAVTKTSSFPNFRPKHYVQDKNYMVTYVKILQVRLTKSTFPTYTSSALLSQKPIFSIIVRY